MVIDGGDIKLVDIRPLNEELQEIAIKELNENPERIADDISLLRNWILKQPHLKARTSDQFLVAFLRGCKYSIEKAKIKIDNYYSMRAGISEVYTNRTLEDNRMLEILRTGVCLRLPKPIGKGGPVITIMRVTAYDINEYSFPEVIKLGTMIGDLACIDDDNSTVSGLIEIMDMTNVTLQHLLHLNPSFMKKCSMYTDEGMPMRHKGIHFISTVPQFASAFKTLNYLMGNKDNRKIHIHGNDLESLYEYVPKEYLPAEYGGTNSNTNDIIEYWENKLLENKEFFKEEESFGTDESLRPGKPRNFDNIFGCDGSFRLLGNID